jgi:hypothetical protein
MEAMGRMVEACIYQAEHVAAISGARQDDCWPAAIPFRFGEMQLVSASDVALFELLGAYVRLRHAVYCCGLCLKAGMIVPVESIETDGTFTVRLMHGTPGVVMHKVQPGMCDLVRMVEERCHVR